MFGLSVQTRDTTKRVAKAAEKAAFRSFAHAAASISKAAKESIERAEGPSAPGQPPHTHRGMFLRRAIRYAADKHGAVIGPMASIVGVVGEVHEFGGTYRGQEFPERPFMAPALEKSAPRFAASWRGQIGA